MLNLWWHPTPYNYLTHYFTTLNYNLSSLTITFSLIVITMLIFNIIFSVKITIKFYFILLFLLPPYNLIIRTANINLGLINALSFWHPILLIVIMVFILKYTYNLFPGVYQLTSIVYVFIILGCWWAGQELLWLGWWNWDGVENSLLVMFIIVFAISHIIKNFYKTTLYKYYIIHFFIIYFFILNKTNLYKSIHSFTNSVTNNYSWLLLMYLIFFVLLPYYNVKLRWFFIYSVIIWTLYILYFLFTNSNIFLKLSFFYILNCVFSCITLLLVNPIIIYIFLVCPDLTYFFLFTVVCLFLSNNLFKIKFHKSILVIFIILVLKLSFKNYIFWTINHEYKTALYNVTSTNRLLIYSSGTSSNVIDVVSQLKLIFKNILFESNYNYVEISSTILLPGKQTLFSINYKTQFYFFLVTLIIYLKQKLKYNYYTIMYVFQSDLTINQQKNRRINTKVSKYHWGTKSVWTNTNLFFILSNQSSIDLRFYKLILRKIKKKFFKYRIHTFVYITPNNKTSHKSKNSRMGKGKGMNNRFYYRHKYTKPVLVFKNFSHLRLLKLKIFLKKFFCYKYY